MNKKKVCILLFLASVTLSACHKNCVCTAFNGVERTYTADEVDALGGNCSYLTAQAGTRLYSFCRWD